MVVFNSDNAPVMNVCLFLELFIFSLDIPKHLFIICLSILSEFLFGFNFLNSGFMLVLVFLLPCNESVKLGIQPVFSNYPILLLLVFLLQCGSCSGSHLLFTVLEESCNLFNEGFVDLS